MRHAPLTPRILGAAELNLVSLLRETNSCYAKPYYLAIQYSLVECSIFLPCVPLEEPQEQLAVTSNKTILHSMLDVPC
jgi:hypothetical protein